MSLEVNMSRLGNLGNTCYQNSVLHPLFHAPGGFIEFIMSGYYLDILKEKFCEESEIYETLIFQFHRILNSIFKSNDCELNINTWKKLVGEKNAFFDGFDQQDSQEFLSYIIDKFSLEVGKKITHLPTTKVNISDFTPEQKILNITADCNWSKYHKKNYSLLVPFFSGMFRTKLTFQDSGKSTNNFTPFNIIPLTIPKISEKVYLKDCLEELTKEEQLDKDNLIKGKFSYGKTFGRKHETIWKLPKYLIFQIKRFKYNDYGQITTKDKTKVNYPLEIDMSEYIDESSKYKKLNNKYQLFGVTLHHGIMMGGFSSGHYVAFVKNRTNKKWYLYNDDNKPIKLKERNIVNQNAYLLYYSRTED